MRREFPPYITYVFVALMSVSLLAMQATLPFKLKELGGDLGAVGFLFTWTSFWYVMSGLFLGWISHHTGPRRVMLATLVICTVMVLLLPPASAVWHIYAITTGYFVSVCLFWSAAEHATTGLNKKLTIAQSTSIYCVAFSIGNAIGTLVSGYLQRQTVNFPFFVSATLTVVVLIIVWITVSPEAGFHRSTTTIIESFPETARARLKRSLLATRTGIVGVYGTYALVVLFLPRYLWEHRGYEKPVAANLASLTLLAMATTFALHGFWKTWPHQLVYVRLAPFVAAWGMTIVCLAPSTAVIAMGVIIIGIASGTAYTHNLYYSLEEPGKRARNAGVHEALIGMAFMVPPLLSGLSARWTHEPSSIFWVGVALAIVCGVMQNTVLTFSSKPVEANSR